jgi:hypothetical protein
VLATWSFLLSITVTASARAAGAGNDQPSRATIAATSSAASSTPATSERLALRDALWRLERLLRTRLAASDPTPSSAELGEERLDERLDALRRAARGLGSEGVEIERKAEALRPLLGEVKRRRSLKSFADAAASPWDWPTRSAALSLSSAGACDDAVPVADGHYTAAIGSADGLWLRRASDAPGLVVVSTAGSDFDTVVEVYDGCPTGDGTPVARGDDEVGLQARVAYGPVFDRAILIHLTGALMAAGTAAIEIQSGATGFAGVVTDESTGQPLERIIRVWNANGSFVTSTETGAGGSFAVLGLTPGSYFASTTPVYSSGNGFLDELYDGFPCPGGATGGCSPLSGTAISVTAGTIVNGIDFALGRGAGIAGRVRDAVTKLGLSGVTVRAYGPAGTQIGEAQTDSAGRYAIAGLAGSVYVLAGDYGSLYAQELYHELPCPSFGGCIVTNGTRIALTVGQVAPGINFTLERFGAVAGTVTRSFDDSPVANVQVSIVDGEGRSRSYGYTDGAGHYVAGGLVPGVYFAFTQSSEFANELYANLDCASGCDPTTGAPITMAANGTTAGIDFALRRLGEISGNVTDGSSGSPLNATLTLFNTAGGYVATAYAYGGAFKFPGLVPGTYFVLAQAYPYRAQLYDHIACGNGPPTGCAPMSGTPVTAADDVERTGVDFALTRLGAVAGTVTDAATGASLDYASIQVWSSSGEFVASSSTLFGGYQVSGLAPGTYFVTVTHGNYQAELFDDLPCPGGPPNGCAPTTGTPVAISDGTTTSGIDFALSPKGSITGTVRDAATSAPLASAEVQVYGAAGSVVRWAYTDNGGAYKVSGLDAGSYRVAADATEHSGELYDNLPCPDASCDPMSGTAVSVTLGAVTGGVDFALDKSGAISGTVSSTSGPSSQSYVSLRDANGVFRAGTFTDSQGRYSLPADWGSWYVIADGGYAFTSQLYNGVPCPGGSCSVSSGNAVSVSAGTTTSGIDFLLAPARGIVGQVVDNSFRPLVGVAIDVWNANGTHVATAMTGPNGFYQLTPNGGNYFVSTDSGLDVIDEVWNNVPCPQGPAFAGLCDPTTGTPIGLASSNALVSGIDFNLNRVPFFASGFEPGDPPWSLMVP